MKHCSKCLQSKPKDGFNKWSRSKDGLQPWCRECQREDRKTEASRARQARYYQANRPRLDLKTKKWVEKNPERRKEIVKKYDYKRYWANPEKWRKYQSAWAKANPEAARLRNAARRARKKNAPGSHTKQEWLDRLAEFNYHCAYCLLPFSDERPPTQDHMIPLVRGGTHNISNIIPACLSCNSQKRTSTPVEFLTRVSAS